MTERIMKERIIKIKIGGTVTDKYNYRSISLRNKSYSRLENLSNIVVKGEKLSNAKTVELGIKALEEKISNSESRPEGIANEKIQQKI